MENKEQLLQDIQYMKQIVNDSRKLIVDGGIDFIVWGILIICGLLITYIDVTMPGNQYSDFAWIILVLFGWMFSIIRWYKNKSKEKTTTFAGRITGSAWLASGITMSIIGFVGPATSAYHGVYISPLMASILGLAFYVSSTLYDSKLMKGISIAWWIGSIYMFVDPGIHTIIVMAALMFFLQLVPGIILYRKYKAERIQNV